MQKTVWKLVKGKWVKIERFWVRVKKKNGLMSFHYKYCGFQIKIVILLINGFSVENKKIKLI